MDRLPTLQESAQQLGASGSSVVEALLLQDRKAVSQTIDLRGDVDGPDVKSSLGAHAFEQAFNSQRKKVM